jgi:hypothetical protein
VVEKPEVPTVVMCPSPIAHVLRSDLVSLPVLEPDAVGPICR